MSFGGIFGNNLEFNKDGVEIRVDSTYTTTGSRTRLIINGKKADESECAIFGMVTLCGEISENQEDKEKKKALEEKKVLLEVRQGPFRTHFRLLVNGAVQKLSKRSASVSK
jgi:hypothetical protein